MLEIDPLTGETIWEYRGTEEAPAFEVTGTGEIVWEFYNPHRSGTDHEFVAALFEMFPRILRFGWAGSADER